MAWSYTRAVLACGCDGVGEFEATLPGDARRCAIHGATTVKRVSRISESTGSRDYRLGLSEPEPEGEEVTT